MTFIKSTLLAAFAVFFVSVVSAQEPAKKADPACQTISDWFGKAEYITREHRNFVDLSFGFVPKDKRIVAFNMSGPCIQGPGIEFRKNHPLYKELYQLVFAGWDT